jgi:hypothetical protein
MFAILHALGIFVADMFKSRYRLQAENLFLRHQLNIALRRASLKVMHAANVSPTNDLNRTRTNIVNRFQIRQGLRAFPVRETRS